MENIKKEENEKDLIIACRCKGKIGNKIIETIIDSGAATSIIMKALLEELELKIKKGSRARFRIANGNIIPAIGIVIVELEIEKVKIPILFQVIDLRKKDLIIETRFLAQKEAVLDFGKKELKLKINGEELSTKVFFNKRKYEIYQEINDEEYEYDEEQELYEENNNTGETDKEWKEEHDHNAAYYLAELTN
jgi:hypothetical protein